MGSRRRLRSIWLIAWLVVACGTPPAPTSVTTPVAVGSDDPAGSRPPVMTAGPAADGTITIDRPAPEVCDRLQRGDTVAARRIREDVDINAIGLPSTDVAVAGAAADPAADIASLGIPLRAEELRALPASGLDLGAETPMVVWVTAGRPDLFGGIWIDPPGSGRHVVSVVHADAAALQLARCLERDGLDVRYVTVAYAKQHLDAIQARIDEDWDDLRASGVRIISAGQRASTNRIDVEVEGLTQAQATALHERYGDAVALTSIPVPTPRLPLTFGDVPVAFGTDTLFSEMANGDPAGDRGRWDLVSGRMVDGQLRLRFSIEPPDVDESLDAGPAVLFAGMIASGGAGDVGIGEPIDALGIVGMPACDPTDCRFEVDVVLPTDAILPAVRRLEERATEIAWLATNLTLVRTFDDGRRLQVIPFDAAGDDLRDQRAGTLAGIGLVDGVLHPFPAFAAADATAIDDDGAWMFTSRFDYAGAVERVRREVEAVTSGG